MQEHLYSDSPYLLIVTITTLFISLLFPALLKKRMAVRQMPKILKAFTSINILWNLCSLAGILFFSGPLQPGTHAYQLRQILFGIQALAWVQIGIQSYRIGELISLQKMNKVIEAIRVMAFVTVLGVTALFLFYPNSIPSLGFFRDNFLAQRPIFASYTFIFLFYVFPFFISASYQLLRSALNSTSDQFNRITIISASVLSFTIIIASAFDFVIPLFSSENNWSKHFLIWHQVFVAYITITSGLYHTSIIAKNKGSHWFLRKLISKMEDGIIYFDDFGKIDFVNGGACKLLNMKAEDMQGKSIRSIFPPNLDFFREVIYNNIKLTINGEVHSFKIHFFKTRQTLTTVFNIAYFTDLSKTMLLQQNLKTLNEQYVEYTHDLVRYQDRLNEEASIKAEKENVLNTLINALPFKVWYKSEKGVYQKQNQLDLDKRGSLEGIIDSPEKITTYENNARMNGIASVYTSFENKEGTEISQDEANKLTKEGELVQTFDNMYIPILQGKPPYKTLCIMVDMTKQRRLEQERNMLREQKFIHSRLEELGTMCGAFAHDYNNILGSQIGFCQLAQEMLPKDHQAYMFISEALKAAERGKTSLNELLDSIRGKASSATPAIVFTPYMIIEDVVKKVSLTLPPTISINSEDMDHSLKISGIVASLDRIISNLANNAIFAMKEKGGTLTFKLSAATLHEQLIVPYVPPIPPGNYAKISVSDTGTGMDSSTLERIFAPFFTTKAPGEGLGLGLSSALRLLKEGNAFFTVQTTLGKGTTFDLYWPLITEK